MISWSRWRQYNPPVSDTRDALYVAGTRRVPSAVAVPRNGRHTACACYIPARERLRGALAALGVFALGLALVSTSAYGIGVSPDSANYLVAGQSLTQGLGYRGVDGEALAIWPPLYSLALAAGPLSGIPILAAARYLHALLAGLTVFGVGQYLHGRVHWWPLSLLASAITLAAPPMIIVQSFAWTEPLFNLAILAALAALSTYLGSGRPRHLAWTIAATAVATLVRYPGVVMIPVAVTCVLVLGQGTLRRRIIHGSFYSLFASAPLALWLVRNILVTGTLAGRREASATTLAMSLDQAAGTFNSWVLPRSLTGLTETSPWLAGGGTVLMAAVGAALVMAAAVRFAKDNVDRRRFGRQVLPLVLFLAGYFLFMLISATSTAIDPLHNRILSPLYLPGLLAVFLAIDRLLRATPAPNVAGTRRVPSAVLTLTNGRHTACACYIPAREPLLLVRRRAWAGLALIVLLLVSAEQGKRRLHYLASEGQGFTSRAYLQRSILADLALLPRGATLWTSHPLFLQCMTGRLAPAWRIPRQGEPSRPAEKPIYLAWFKWQCPSQRTSVMPNELHEYFEMEPCFTRSDGAIYRMEPYTRDVKESLSYPSVRKAERRNTNPR